MLYNYCISLFNILLPMHIKKLYYYEEKKMAKNSNLFAVLALVCGICGIVFSFVPYVNYAAIAFSIASIVFGAIGIKKANAGSGKKGMAVAGLVIGIVSVAFYILGLTCIGVCAGIIASIE